MKKYPTIASMTVTVNGVVVSLKEYNRDYNDVYDAMLAFSDSDDPTKANSDYHDLYHRLENEHGPEYAEGMIERVADESIMPWSE